MIQTDKVLDAKNLACPMPIVKTRKAIKEMTEGQVLEVHSTDTGTTADLKAWSESAGHQYIGNVQEDGVWRHFVRKSDKEEWQERTYPFTVANEKLTDKLEEPGTVLIDVRESAEYTFNHIPGALSIPLGQLEERIEHLDKKHKYFIVCRTGNRSDMACQKLAAQGFECVTNVVPGMSKWHGNTENTAGGMKR
ncbi:sulfurtransferase TusA family protein [Sporosarcina cascadiensis]|uniref:sulfurtransferase TusA family protein n=1 Tax=Sporosarcina cascadiensis TaxID=2660747 RepID=UPI00129AD3FB|nr:sulfurtransferase TusA family protein [Sporosarcina cascadiensis]